MRLWQGGNWKTWLGIACERLRDHPVFVKPETVFANSETIEVAKEAKITCDNYVWNRK